LVTAHDDAKSEIRALDAGAVDCVSKPVNGPVVRARVSTHLQLKRQSDELRELIKQDPLTGISNRRALEEYSSLEWRRARRHGRPLAVLMIDIDHFKAYNDHYGHVPGDACLRKVAQAIEASVPRPGDLTVRFGGEEFAVLLPDTTGPQAVIVAEQIRAAVRALAIPHARSPVGDRVTVSIGVAAGVPRNPLGPDYTPIPPGDPPSGPFALNKLETLFNRADAALYAAKQAGRDRVALQQDSPDN
jgi:diguanylate cyclase (GGDEF)-like protein